MNNFWERL